MNKITTVLILFSLFMTGCSNQLNVILKESIIIKYGSNGADVDYFNIKESDKNIKVKEIKRLDTSKIREQMISLSFTDGKKKL